ncbi:enoyl-CoA hydratase/isomerase family protein [Oikeobacillus pervagus]|nr:enoyl-CoA hydratase [Oikeobacillus pervagus]
MGIATVILNNLPLNLLNQKVVQQLSNLADELHTDDSIHAVILTGAGEKAFMAGADIKEFPEWIGKGEAFAEQKGLELQDAFHKFYRLPKPTIAALNGLALGGGCELALACDLRIMEQHAIIGLPEIKLGLFPGAGGTQRLPRLIGETKAKQMMFLGDSLTANEALHVGLVNEVVPKGNSLNRANAIAQRLTSYSLPALSYMKKSIQQGLQVSLETGLSIEAQHFGKVFQTEEIKTGVQHFIEKHS